MGEMIERVARALNEATELALETHGRFDTRQMARAAIEAMMEPSEVMVAAAGSAVFSPSFAIMWPKIAAEIYGLMITAALKEADRSGLRVSVAESGGTASPKSDKGSGH